MSYYCMELHRPISVKDNKQKREDLIKRAKCLKDDPNYPSDEIISQIADRIIGEWMKK